MQRPGMQVVKGAGWVDLSRPVTEGRREEDGVRYKATTDEDTGLTVIEHADGRQDAIARPRAIRMHLGMPVSPETPPPAPASETCNCCRRPHAECYRARRGR